MRGKPKITINQTVNKTVKHAETGCKSKKKIISKKKTTTMKSPKLGVIDSSKQTASVAFD